MSDLVLEIKVPAFYTDDLPKYIEEHDTDLLTELLDGEILDSAQVGLCLIAVDGEVGGMLRTMDGLIVGARIEGEPND